MDHTSTSSAPASAAGGQPGASKPLGARENALNVDSSGTGASTGKVRFDVLGSVRCAPNTPRGYGPYSASEVLLPSIDVGGSPCTAVDRNQNNLGETLGFSTVENCGMRPWFPMMRAVFLRSANDQNYSAPQLMW